MTNCLTAGARSGRLLIVDDDAGVTQTFAGLLRLEGYEVRTANDAHEGLHEVEAFRPDAIILDLRMPLINGLGFLYRLRDRVAAPQIPITVITGDAAPSDDVLTDIKEFGADLRFKPIWSDELLAIAERLLSRSAPTVDGSSQPAS